MKFTRALTQVTALRCSTAPALLSAEGLSAFGRFPNWLAYGACLLLASCHTRNATYCQEIESKKVEKHRFWAEILVIPSDS